ncbi:MAG: ferritin-like domain-containing protein [Opitutaceae bacterium]|nr:ferritin-like domain-containing protein [Opitutaceae bacterium]
MSATSAVAASASEPTSLLPERSGGFQPPSTSASTPSPASAPAPAPTGRLAAVQEMARWLRLLFETEREFVRTATTLIYRVGEPELKYLLCQHVWEAASHARFIRERGRELSGFGTTDDVRPALRQLFNEAVMPADATVALAGFYRVIKPALHDAYRHYLTATHHLADWPSRKLVEEFLADEARHADEMAPYLPVAASASKQTTSTAPELLRLGEARTLPSASTASEKSAKINVPTSVSDSDLVTHLAQLTTLLASHPTLFPCSPSLPLSASPSSASPSSAPPLLSATHPYTHPPTCHRGRFPTCSSVFSDDPAETPVVRAWLIDPTTDARVIRIMVYVWLMMELDAVDYLATVFYDTPHAPFDLHHDLARHLWDESRHSQFGYRQLPRLGVDLLTLEHSLDLYTILVQMTPPERYAMMTMEFEANSFPTKAHVMDRVRELNDFEADTLLAFDRNDEQNHVRSGHRWLPVMMALFGETRSPEDFVTATRARFTELAKSYGGITPHSLPPSQRLTGEKILRLIK